MDFYLLYGCKCRALYYPLASWGYIISYCTVQSCTDFNNNKLKTIPVQKKGATEETQLCITPISHWYWYLVFYCILLLPVPVPVPAVPPVPVPVSTIPLTVPRVWYLGMVPYHTCFCCYCWYHTLLCTVQYTTYRTVLWLFRDSNIERKILANGTSS